MIETPKIEPKKPAAPKKTAKVKRKSCSKPAKRKPAKKLAKPKKLCAANIIAQIAISRLGPCQMDTARLTEVVLAMTRALTLLTFAEFEAKRVKAFQGA